MNQLLIYIWITLICEGNCVQSSPTEAPGRSWFRAGSLPQLLLGLFPPPCFCDCALLPTYTGSHTDMNSLDLRGSEPQSPEWLWYVEQGEMFSPGGLGGVTCWCRVSKQGVKVSWCLCWWWDSPAGTSALLPGSASVLGADPVTCVTSSPGFLSVLLLKVLKMKDFVGFYLEEALEQNIQPINCSKPLSFTYCSFWGNQRHVPIWLMLFKMH